MNWFLIISVTVCGGLFTFLGYRITPLGAYSWWAAGLLVGTILLYPLVWYGVLPVLLDQAVRAVVHFNLGLVSLLIPVLLFRDLLAGITKIFRPEWASALLSGSSSLWIFALLTVVLGYGYWHARRGPTTVTVEVPIVGLPDGLHHYTILQISDLHTGAGIDGAYVDRVVRQARDVGADVVVLTGDIADGSFERFRSAVAPLARLTMDSRVLYVVGNHEYLRDSDQWLRYYAELGIEPLLNQHTVVTHHAHSLLFAGVIDPEVKEVHPESGPDLKQALLNSPETDIRILLSHRPDIAPQAASEFDLQLSGHTHAGQFFPWSLAIRLFQPYYSGLKQCGQMWVYTNPGTGYWGPPFRILTASELTVLKLVRASR